MKKDKILVGLAHITPIWLNINKTIERATHKKYYLLYFLVSLIVFSACHEKNQSLKPSFLIGSWERVNDDLGNATFENWNTDFTGNGYTLKNVDTIFKEDLFIIILNDSLFLKVTGVHENPTLFKFTNQTDTSFVCKNPNNEFPKEINYWIENDSLKAKASNEDFSIAFIFRRTNN